MPIQIKVHIQHIQKLKLNIVLIINDQTGWKPNPVVEKDLICVEDVCPNLHNETVEYGKWSCNPPVQV